MLLMNKLGTVTATELRFTFKTFYPNAHEQPLNDK